MVNPNPDLKSRNCQRICHFQGGVLILSTQIQNQDRLDKSHSVLAEERLKIHFTKHGRRRI